ncbi:hypothetical protein [Edwardsiella tarda]|uniref:hypothetical protein n=1 Tax=Edwardsiella tarda TaxID=636 RepID=UPI00351C0074
MRSKLLNIIKVVDKTSIYSMSQLLIRALSGPASILLIAKNLTIDQQAIYYIFISVSSIQWVFELGMSTCLVQFLSGEKDIKKTNDYITFGFYYFSLCSIITLIATSIYCYWVLGAKDISYWLLPWFLYATALAGTILLNIQLVTEESTGKIENVYKSKFIASVFQTIVLLGSLFMGGHLYALGLGGLTYMIVLLYLLRHQTLYILSLVSKFNKSNISRTFKKIMPFQSRMALVWISGYFYWNFYNIYIYKYISIDLSAKFGLVNAALSAISFAMIAIFQTKRSNISKLIFSREKEKTSRIFYNSLSIGSFGYISLSVIFILLSMIMSIDTRLLSGILLLSFIVLRFLSMLLEYVLIYLRCFRCEPLSNITTFSYIIIPISSVLSYNIFGSVGIFAIPLFCHFIFLFISVMKAVKFIKRFKI